MAIVRGLPEGRLNFIWYKSETPLPMESIVNVDNTYVIHAIDSIGSELTYIPGSVLQTTPGFNQFEIGGYLIVAKQDYEIPNAVITKSLLSIFGSFNLSDFEGLIQVGEDPPLLTDITGQPLLKLQSSGKLQEIGLISVQGTPQLKLNTTGRFVLLPFVGLIGHTKLRLKTFGEISKLIEDISFTGNSRLTLKSRGVIESIEPTEIGGQPTLRFSTFGKIITLLPGGIRGNTQLSLKTSGSLALVPPTILQGNPEIALRVSGVLQPIQPDNILGTTKLKLKTSGFLEQINPGSIQGNVTLRFKTSGLINSEALPSKEFVGDTNLRLTSVGSIRSIQPGGLRGRTKLSLKVSGALVGKEPVDFTGNTQVRFTTSGSLAAIPPLNLTGTPQLKVTTTGFINSIPPLNTSGTVQLGFKTRGFLTAIPPIGLIGQPQLRLNTFGSLVAIPPLNLVGNSQLKLTASGSLVAIPPLTFQGTSQLRLQTRGFLQAIPPTGLFGNPKLKLKVSGRLSGTPLNFVPAVTLNVQLPESNQLFQYQNATKSGFIRAKGTFAPIETNTAIRLEAKYGADDWREVGFGINGEFDLFYEAPPGQETFEIRPVTQDSFRITRTLIGIGELFLISGDSWASGRTGTVGTIGKQNINGYDTDGNTVKEGFNIRLPDGRQFKLTYYANDETWRIYRKNDNKDQNSVLDYPYDLNDQGELDRLEVSADISSSSNRVTAGNGHWEYMAQLLVERLDPPRPVAFQVNAKGGSTVVIQDTVDETEPGAGESGVWTDLPEGEVRLEGGTKVTTTDALAVRLRSWLPSPTNHADPTFLYGSMLTRYRQSGNLSCRGILTQLGTNDTNPGRPEEPENFAADMESFAAAIREDFNCPLFLPVIADFSQHGGRGNDPVDDPDNPGTQVNRYVLFQRVIRQLQTDITNNINSGGDFNVIQPTDDDRLHIYSRADNQLASEIWADALVEYIESKDVSGFSGSPSLRLSTLGVLTSKPVIMFRGNPQLQLNTVGLIESTFVPKRVISGATSLKFFVSGNIQSLNYVPIVGNPKLKLRVSGSISSQPDYDQLLIPKSLAIWNFEGAGPTHTDERSGIVLGVWKQDTTTTSADIPADETIPKLPVEARHNGMHGLDFNAVGNNDDISTKRWLKTNDPIDIADSTKNLLPTPSNVRTYAFWAKIDEAGDTRRIGFFSAWKADEPLGALLAFQTNSIVNSVIPIRFAIISYDPDNNTGTQIQRDLRPSSPGILVDDGWFHFVVIWDGFQTDWESRIQVIIRGSTGTSYNYFTGTGNLANPQFNIKNVGNALGYPNHLRIGSTPPSWSAPRGRVLRGQLGPFYIFNQALSVEELDHLYNEGNGHILRMPPPIDLVGSTQLKLTTSGLIAPPPPTYSMSGFTDLQFTVSGKISSSPVSQVKVQSGIMTFPVNMARGNQLVERPVIAEAVDPAHAFVCFGMSSTIQEAPDQLQIYSELVGPTEITFKNPPAFAARTGSVDNVISWFLIESEEFIVQRGLVARHRDKDPKWALPITTNEFTPQNSFPLNNFCAAGGAFGTDDLAVVDFNGASTTSLIGIPGRTAENRELSWQLVTIPKSSVQRIAVSGSQGPEISLPENVVPNRTFLVHQMVVTDQGTSSDIFPILRFSGSLTAPASTVRLQTGRFGTANNSSTPFLAGAFFVVQALNSAFTVQHHEFSFGETGAEGLTQTIEIDPVPKDKTFCLSTGRQGWGGTVIGPSNGQSEDHAGETFFRFELVSDNPATPTLVNKLTVTRQRRNQSSDVVVQVITFT